MAGCAIPARIAIAAGWYTQDLQTALLISYTSGLIQQRFVLHMLQRRIGFDMNPKV